MKKIENPSKKIEDIKRTKGCTRMAQLIKRLTFNFSLRHDLMVMKLRPKSGSALGMELA